jgi:DNA-directed DNA polymerase III PolC
MFTHLRLQSSYSFLRGLASPQALVQRAAQQGLPALALTDHHSLTGAVEFVEACRDAGVRPILGLEINLGGTASIPATGVVTLLALDQTGWRGLCRIASSLENDESNLAFEKLAQETDGLLCLTGGWRGALATQAANGQFKSAETWLNELAEIFPDRLYVELQRHTAEDTPLTHCLADMAAHRRLPIVATHDVHTLDPEQAHLQRVVSAIRRIQPITSLPDAACAPPDASFLAPDIVATRFSDLPAALASVDEIVHRCQFDLPLGVPHFPEIELPPGLTALDVLRQKAEAGAKRYYDLTPGPSPCRRGEPLPANITARLEHELAVIGECGYAVLFLIVEDILGYARHCGVPISSRGSAASSLVAHCLGITSPDPMRLNLYFERFLNPARATPPDIDTDLCSRRREDVIRYVYQRFGQERVATVCTINRFRSRSALRETAKAHGLPTEEVSRLAESLPHRWYGPRRSDEGDPFAELAETHPDARHQAIFQDARALIGLPHHLSVHPGGMVIAPSPMNDLVPTTMAAKGVTITQFDLDSIERMGLVKIDLLGIRGLTVIGDVAETVVSDVATEKRKGNGAGPRQIHLATAPTLEWLEAISEDDVATRETILNGRTIGCFQIESPGMRATLREIRAQSVDDLMVALALYRPGPLTGGLKDAFVRRHLGLEAATQLHSALTPLLADTYGVILYQEQVLRIAHELAGLSLADADLLRRAMSHFDPGKQMKTLQEKFIAGAFERHGVPPETSQRVWELMAAFAGYGFPKAHAASYAQIGWRAAWCKTHHPALFLGAVLANWGGYYSQRVYLTEARRRGLRISPPHVNHAGQQFSVRYLESEPVLFMGLDQVRDLTRRTQAAIMREQPFRSLQDFLVRVDPRPIEAENLIRVGALEGFGTIPALLEGVLPGGWRGGQFSLFDLAPAQREDWSLAEKVAAQEEILGTGVIAHPLELAAEAIRAAGALTTIEAASRLGQRVRVAGMRQTWRRSITSRGDYIYFMALEDLEGMLDVIIPGEVYRRCRAAFATAGPYVIEGVVERDQQQGDAFLRAERAALP